MKIPESAIESLKQELQAPEEFARYGEVQTWFKAVLGIEVKEHVVHNLVRYKLKAKLKASRPRSTSHDRQA
jgi:putative transposase